MPLQCCLYSAASTVLFARTMLHMYWLCQLNALLNDEQECMRIVFVTVISPVEDNTQVTITLRGSQIDSFTLNRGQVYQYLMPYTSSGRRKRDVLKRVKRGGKKSNKSNKSTKTTTTPSSSGACSISASISK